MTSSYKIVLLGESGVGKTCIITQFAKNNFDQTIVTSLTAELIKKKK